MLLDNGAVCCLSGVIPFELWQGRSYVIVRDEAHSIAFGKEHALIVSKKGAILGLGYKIFETIRCGVGRCDRA